MTSNEILKADLLDIIFDNRNKQYGAYALRKNYNTRMMLALGITFGMAFCFFLIINPKSSSGNSVFINDPEELIVRHVVIPEEAVIPPQPTRPPQATPQPNLAQGNLTNQIDIVDDSKRTEDIATQQDLQNLVVSNTNMPGVEVPDNVSHTPPVAGNGNGITTEKIPEETGAALPSSAPEFPGGAEAWLAFLNRHLNSPNSLEAGEKKTVMVRFYVDTHGSITNFNIVQSGGREFDNEVIRVLKKMPKWKPAIQNGVPVSVSFTQPVTFIGVEE